MDPKTAEEYVEKHSRNENVTGYGLDTTIHLPCPFCAESDFVIAPIMQVQQALENENVCNKCGRGLKISYEFDESTSTLKMEPLQTCGSEPAPYLPKFRRVN